MKNLIIKLFLLIVVINSCSKKNKIIPNNKRQDLVVLIKEKQDSVFRNLKIYEKRQLFHTLIASDNIRKKIFHKAAINKNNNSDIYILELTRAVDYAYYGYYIFKNMNLMYKVFYQPSYDSSNKIRDLIITTKYLNPNSCIVKVIEDELNLNKNISNCDSETSYIATKCSYDINNNAIINLAFFCRRENDKKQVDYLMNVNRGCD